MVSESSESYVLKSSALQMCDWVQPLSQSEVQLTTLDPAVLPPGTSPVPQTYHAL